MPDEEVLSHFVKFNNSLGRMALKHNSIKVMGSKKSIQGEWKDNLWEQYPKHLLETQREIPYSVIKEDEQIPVPIKDKIVRPHVLTNYAKKKFFLPKYNYVS